mmetsp:Transcript_8628/g.24797  ORF Transcript_8628/g.24797 Transcript_8628/m.24797 type:complete len:272 (+) Transcript_8628:203-1018(+)
MCTADTVAACAGPSPPLSSSPSSTSGGSAPCPRWSAAKMCSCSAAPHGCSTQEASASHSRDPQLTRLSPVTLVAVILAEDLLKQYSTQITCSIPLPILPCHSPLRGCMGVGQGTGSRERWCTTTGASRSCRPGDFFFRRPGATLPCMNSMNSWPNVPSGLCPRTTPELRATRAAALALEQELAGEQPSSLHSGSSSTVQRPPSMKVAAAVLPRPPKVWKPMSCRPLASPLVTTRVPSTQSGCQRKWNRAPDDPKPKPLQVPTSCWLWRRIQ